MLRKFLLDTAEILLCLYAVVKHLLGKIGYIKKLKQSTVLSILIGLLTLLLALLSLVLLVIILLPLAGYRKSVDIILRLRYRKDYGGLLQGFDNFWTIETENSRHIINCLLMLEYGDPNDQLIPFLKKIFTDHFLEQFTGLRKNSMGFNFRLQNQVTAHDLIKEWELSDEAMTDKQIFDGGLMKVSNTPLAMGDTACFELLASKTPIKFLNKNGHENRQHIYPLLLRIHHSVGDGVALLSFLLKNLADEQISVEEEIAKKFEVMRKGKKRETNAKSFVNYIDSTIKMTKKIAEANMYYFPPTTKADKNILHGPPLSGNQILSSYLEAQPGYIAKVKSIKKRIPDSSFTDVLLTAVSAAFYQHFKDNDDEIPSSITLSFALKPLEKNLEYIVTQTGEKEYKLGNDFSVGTLVLPINVEVKNSDTALRERMLMIKRETEKLKNAMDILVNYWQMRFFTNLLPTPLLRLLMALTVKASVSFSNLPGIPAVHIKGHKVHDIVFWVPVVGNTGVGLSILTYDNRFQMGLLASRVTNSHIGLSAFSARSANSLRD